MGAGGLAIKLLIILTLQFDPHEAISRLIPKLSDDLARPRPITDPDLISGGPVNLSTESSKIPEISRAQIATSATSDEKLVAPSTDRLMQIYQYGKVLLMPRARRVRQRELRVSLALVRNVRRRDNEM